MSNYITTLRGELAAQHDRSNATRAAILDFRCHLASAKFQNVDGAERRDWIAVGDVLRWLGEIESELG